MNSSTQASGQRPGEVLVRFRGGVAEQDKAAAVAAHGGRRKGQLRGESGIEKLEVAAGQDTETVALQLRLNPAVEFAEPNFLIKRDDLGLDAGARNIARPFTGPNQPSASDFLNPTSVSPYLGAPSANAGSAYANSPTPIPSLQSPGGQLDDPRFQEQWSLRNTGQSGGQFGSDIGVTAAWQTTTGSQSTVIAVIDSGIDFTHPDLRHNKWINPAPGVNGDVNGWDYITDSGVIRDEQGHGTAIAGIIGAQGNNGLGISGVMWRASLMSLRVLDSTGTGDIANAVEAIDYAVAHGAQVINISWGTTSYSIALKNAIERAIRQGVVVVCSSGNSGQDIDSTPYYPAAFNIRNLITVASTDNFDQLATWSNWGSRRVSVAAPGVNILTTQMGGGYWTVTGTSASSPLVAGVAGLMKSYRPLEDVSDIRSALVDGSRPVASLAGKVSAAGVVNTANGFAVLQSNPYVDNGSGGNNGNPPGGGQSNVPPGQRQDDEGRRANGRQGHRVSAPTARQGAPAANLPNLEESRRVRTSPNTPAPSAPIQSNLLCADCDPGGGGGAGGSDPYFGTGRTRPENETGDPGVTLGSRNFNWSMPLVNLKGRAGLDLSIALYYNSLVWTRQGTSIQYNADHGTPAPGFQIGLPRLQAQYFDTDDGVYGHIMITPSGGRMQMKQVSAGIFESSDGTYTQLTFVGGVPVVKTTDGTQYWFGDAFTGEWRCTKIQDRNGNYISATYLATTGQINTITDTLGRILEFKYYAAPDNNLWKIEQVWSGVAHKWAEFVYGSVPMSFNFPGLSVVGASQGVSKTVLSYVQFSDNTRYHFDYNSYGQVYQIRHNAPDGHELEHTLYTINTSGAQTDCPRFTDRRDYAQDWNNYQEAITSYAVTNNATWTNPETGAQQTGTLVEQTAPDGITVYKEYSRATGWDSGLTQLTEVWSAGVKRKWTSMTWTQNNTGVNSHLKVTPFSH